MVQSNKEKFFKGMSAQTLVTIVMGVLNIIVFSVMSRLLSKEVFGYYAVLWAVVAIFQCISEAGLGSAVIQKKNCSDSFYSTAFSLSLLLSTFLGVLLFFSAPLLSRLISNETLEIPMRCLSVILITTSVESVGRGILIRNLKFLKFGIIQIVSYFVSYGIGIILAINGWGLYSLVVAALLNSISICILTFSTGVRIPKLSIVKQDCREIVSFGGWLTASVIVNQLTVQLDKLVLSKWMSPVSLGSYSRPSGFVSSINEKVNSIVDTTLFPILSSVQDNASQVAGALKRSMSMLNSFSIVLAATFFFNAELIISIFFGHDWLDLVGVFRVFSLGVIFSVDARLVDCFFRSLGLVKANFFLRSACMVIMISALYFGAKHGVFFAAVAVVSANFVAVVIKMFYLCSKTHVKISDILGEVIRSFRPIILLCVIGIPFILYKTSTIIQLLFAAVFVIIVLTEFFIFPQMVGHRYVEEMGDTIGKIKSRFGFPHNSIQRLK